MSEVKKPSEDIPESVHITSYPKIIYMWPSWIASFVIWLISIISGFYGDIGVLPEYTIYGWVWIGIFTFNLFVIAFEFTAGKFLVIVLLLIGYLALMFAFPSFFPSTLLPELGLSHWFYVVVAIIFAIVYFLLWLSRRFNYLEITHQQISYHVGILADERRYPAPGIHFEKITEDVFERIMPPFSAKLIMKTEKGDIAEIMECVPRINKKLAQIKKILDYLQVKQT